jgi:hypothetical protein
MLIEPCYGTYVFGHSHLMSLDADKASRFVVSFHQDVDMALAKV